MFSIYVIRSASSPTLRAKQSRENHGRQRTRRPFHYQTHISVPRTESPVIPSPDAVPYDNAQEATYSRYKYYQRLRGPPVGDDTALVKQYSSISNISHSYFKSA